MGQAMNLPDIEGLVAALQEAERSGPKKSGETDYGKQEELGGDGKKCLRPR
jgi:hypothetical protein